MKPLLNPIFNRNQFHQRFSQFSLNSLAQTRFFCTNLATDLSNASIVPEEKSPLVFSPQQIRNVAIIAHVDHGKTTLVDRILKQCEVKLSNERMMDSNAIEKERGITILSKVTAVTYENSNERMLLNVVDTPGHADFGGEVERVLSMVDGAVLLVDALEGPMTQTKFVLSKALQYKLRPIVVVNKVDREAAEAGIAESAVFDLLLSMDASDEQLDFPTLYASAREGWVSSSFSDRECWKEKNLDVTALLDTITNHVPAPKVDLDAPFSFLVTMISRDPFLGKIVTGRVHAGQARVGDAVKVMTRDGEYVGEGRVSKVRASRGLKTAELPVAIGGDIVSMTGIECASVGDTISALEVTAPLFAPKIDPPTVSVFFSVNDSPLKGKEGVVFTSQKLSERLLREAESNVSITVGSASGISEQMEVQGRGELQLGILIENLRREGIELAISPPRVLFQTDPSNPRGPKLEPIEDLIVEVDEMHAGSIIEKLSRRHGHLIDMTNTLGDRVRVRMTIPSRCLIGFRPIFIQDTRGSGIMYSTFSSYEAYRGDTGDLRKGVIVSMAAGTASAYALESVQERGTLFIKPGTDVYAGMIVGESAKEHDLSMNPVKEKKASNIRTTLKEESIKLVPPRLITLEEAIGYVQPGELIEVTPKSIRMRKLILDCNLRRSAEKSNKAYN
uniref:Tr-type G domain-containing protein n=1 Tax=Timspurckia oligopyrenoides TaxID=708627 RepID=A0A7S0ZHY3_9RHOD